MAAWRIRVEQNKTRLRIIALRGSPLRIIALFRIALQRDAGERVDAITHDRARTLKR